MSYSGKTLMLGNPAVGKTSLLSRFTDGIFKEEYNATIGANFFIKEIDIKEIVEKLDIDPLKKADIQQKGFKLYWWDIGGQSDKLFVTEYYFLQAVGAIIVFDVTNLETFINIEFWASKLKELSGDIPFLLVGNKIDILQNRKVSSDEAKEKATKLGVKYIETSAKLDQNVNKAFEILVIEIINNMK